MWSQICVLILIGTTNFLSKPNVLAPLDVLLGIPPRFLFFYTHIDTKDECHYNLKNECISSIGCGWCNTKLNSTSTNTTICKYIGDCDISMHNSNVCEYRTNRNFCNLSKFAGWCLLLVYFFGITITLIISFNNCIYRVNAGRCGQFLLILVPFGLLLIVVISWPSSQNKFGAIL